MTFDRVIAECIDGHKEKCPGHITAVSGSSTGTKCACFCHKEDEIVPIPPKPKKKLEFLSSVCQEKIHDGCPVSRPETEEFGGWTCPCECHGHNKTRT
jgi:hypothetical protein